MVQPASRKVQPGLENSLDSHAPESTNPAAEPFRFLMVPDAIASDPGLSPGAKLLFGAILTLSKGKLGKCVAGNEKLALMTGISVVQVRRLLRTLEARGLISRVMENHERSEILIAAAGLPTLGREGVYQFDTGGGINLIQGGVSKRSTEISPRADLDDRPTTPLATLPKFGPETRESADNHATTSQGGDSPEGISSAAPPPPAAAHDDEKVPVAVLDAIRAELGESVAAEVGRCHVQFRDACKGRWEVLIAAARDIGKSIKAGKPVSSPVGLLDSKTRKFVKEGVPADVAVRVAPQQNHNPSQPKCDPGPSIPREVAMQYIYESAGRPVPPQAKPDNRRIFTASPEQRARYEAEQAQYEAAQSARKPSHTPFPKATAEDEAWTRQREENLREKMRTKRQVESVAV